MNSTTEHEAFLRIEQKGGRTSGRKRRLLWLGLTLPLAMSTAASAQTYRVLKDFSGSDGSNPDAGLVLAGNTLYGTTMLGGSSGNGVIFKLNTDGSGYAVLKNFSGADGRYPGYLTLEGSTLYGTTESGGTSGAGVVFKVSTDGTGFTLLRQFGTPPYTGGNPYGGMILLGNTLYGWGNGYNGANVLFKINTDGSGYGILRTNIHGSPEGAIPYGTPVLVGGAFYGTMSWGGTSGNGVIYRVNIDGSGYAVLKSFSGTDGYNPLAGLILGGNTLYGTTSRGGAYDDNDYAGVVFKMNTDGSDYTVLKSFTYYGDNDPEGGLVLSGSTLFGTTARPAGKIFKLNIDGSAYTVLKDFDWTGGASPYGALVLAGGTLYGTTVYGGSAYNGYIKGFGVVYSLTLATGPPTITSPPLSQTAEVGSAPCFSVKVANSAPAVTGYQWCFNSTNALSGATYASLTLTNVQPAQAGAYAVVVTSMGFCVTSAPALLSVISPVERRAVPALRLTGGVGSLLHVEYADSLAYPQWSSVSDVMMTGVSQVCFDPCQPQPSQRFYRVRQTGGPASKLDASVATAITLSGALGSSVRVDYINAVGPTDAWVTLDTTTLTNTMQLYYDLTAYRQPPRLYRLVPVP